MRNLKRALSLVMAAAMLIGMMVVGASAASYEDFTDKDEIHNQEAVKTLVALNVINGKEDGSYFDPTGIVTRAEMAKMITVALNGGKEPTLGVKDKPTFSDIKGTWAEAYIEYCTSPSVGIISGRGDGRFDPTAPVTAAEAAKMLLTALGYDATVFKLTGASWQINTDVHANDAHLYDDLSITSSAQLTRDNAAQMIYNALNAYVMVKTYDKVLSNGEVSYSYALSTTKTLLSEKFDAKIYIGTFVGNTNTRSGLKDGYIVVDGKLNTSDATTTVEANFPSDLGIANIGEEVKVIFKDGTGGTADKPDGKDTIYGVYVTGATTVYNITKADMQDAGTNNLNNSKIKFGGSTYKVASSVDVITNYITDSPVTYTSATALQSALKAQSADTIKFVTDNDGNITKAYVVNNNIGKVTAVTSSKVTIQGIGAFEIEGNEVYSDIAKDDVVVYNKLYDTNTDDAYIVVSEAETVEGVVKGYKTNENVVLDGTTYKIHNNTLANVSDDALTALASSDIDKSVIAYMVGGMVGALNVTSEGTSTYALVLENNNGTLDANFNALQVMLLLPDGTKVSGQVHKDSIKTTGGAAVDAAAVAAGTLVKYVMSGEKIKITDTKLASAAVAITGTSATGNALLWNKDTKALTYSAKLTAVAATDAPLYALVNGEYYVYNMRGLGSIANTTGGVEVNYFLSSTTGQVVAAYAELDSKPGSSTADTLYGIVTSYVGTRVIDDDTYFQYTVWTGEETTVYASNDTSIAAGDIVSFDQASDNKYDQSTTGGRTPDISVLRKAADGTLTGADAIAVNRYTESSKLLSYYTGTTGSSILGYTGGSASSITVDDDVKIVYVNAKDKAAGDAIGVNSFDATTGFANALIVKDANGVVVGIIVETSGDVNMGGSAFGNPTMRTVSVTATGATAYDTNSVSPASVEDGFSGTVTVSIADADGTPTANHTYTITYTVDGGAPQTATYATGATTAVGGALTFNVSLSNVSANVAINVTSVA